MKKFLYISLLLISFNGIKAQQVAIYSQYMFNPFMINPAYAGSRDALSGVLLFRQQWVGIEGAPATQTFSMHSGIGQTKLAAGINVINDVVGPTRNSGALLTCAYHLQLGKGKLSFGLRGGMFNSRLDNSKLNYNNPTDKFNTMNTISTMVPSFDAGLYYYTRKFYAGLSTTHLTQSKFDFENYPTGTNLFLKRHFMVATGYAAEISPKVVFKPSILVKYVSGAPVNIDLNASFLFNKVFWLGASFRSGNGVTFISEFYVTDWARIGYSYDLVMNRLKKFTLGTHEIVAGFDLNIKKVKHVSPRYL
ncbi:MAG TPA: type IX secretion system membrane protein PorP/SprF [Flavobacteriales bacterium]|nr:type IX secretion system membrane protein PorP/SprF [Flavobacteriales bacterium]